MGFDELVTMSEDNYTYMFSRLRNPLSVKIPLRIRATTNPPKTADGKWCYDRFVNPDYSHTRDINERIFLASSLYDNPYIDHTDYVKNLANLDETTRKQLLDGDWEVRYEGTLFKQEHEKYIPKEKLPLHRRKCMYWDLAATSAEEAKLKGKEPDYTCGVLMSESGGNYYVEKIIHGRFSPEETLNIQVREAKINGRSCIIRDELQPGAAGKMLLDFKKRTTELGKFNFDAVRGSGSKLKRAEPIASEFSKGNVYFVEGLDNLSILQDEMYTFGLSRHDDTVDALSGAFGVLQEMSKSSAPKMIGVRNSAFAQTSSGLYVPNNGNYWRNF